MAIPDTRESSFFSPAGSRSLSAAIAGPFAVGRSVGESRLATFFFFGGEVEGRHLAARKAGRFIGAAVRAPIYGYLSAQQLRRSFDSPPPARHKFQGRFGSLGLERAPIIHQITLQYGATKSILIVSRLRSLR